MFKKTVIIGLGLMGGSLAAALRKKNPKAHITGVALRKATLDFARRKKWIDEGCFSLSAALYHADLAVICTPVDMTYGILKEIDRTATQPILVTDVGSVKAPVCTLAQKTKWKHVRFIGAHPMVGSHEQGIESARANLYASGLTLITAKKSQPGFSSICAFWKSVSREIRVLSPVQHDQQVAEISHLPHLLSVCLMQTASPAARKIAAAGFRDTTRLAGGPASVWSPIFVQNRKEILRAIKAFKINIDHFEAALKSGNTSKLTALLTNPK